MDIQSARALCSADQLDAITYVTPISEIHDKHLLVVVNNGVAFPLDRRDLFRFWTNSFIWGSADPVVDNKKRDAPDLYATRYYKFPPTNQFLFPSVKDYIQNNPQVHVVEISEKSEERVLGMQIQDAHYMGEYNSVTVDTVHSISIPGQGEVERHERKLHEYTEQLLLSDDPDFVDTCVNQGILQVSQKLGPAATPLPFFIAHTSNLTMMRWILDKGGNVDDTNKRGQSCIFGAMHNSVEMVMLLLDRGAAVDKEDKHSMTAGTYAIIERVPQLIEKLELLLSNGAVLNRRATNGRTLLSATVQAGSVETFDWLLARGAAAPDDLFAICCQYHTQNMLGRALEHTLTGCVRPIIDYNRVDYLKSAVDGGVDVSSALAYLAEDSDGLVIEAVDVPGMLSGLLEAGVDLNALNPHGHSALGIASMHNNKVLVESLLTTEGIDVDVGNETPLFLATISGFCDVVAALLAAGADANRHNPLGAAIASGNADMVAILANVCSSRMYCGESILNQAVETGMVDIITMLLEKITFSEDELMNAHAHAHLLGAYDVIELLRPTAAQE